MSIEKVELGLIDDNPYQPRQVYHKEDIDNIAASIEIHGQLQTPLARRKDGRAQLAFGHLRKRGFLKLAKEDPDKWGAMPLDIREFSDEQMAMFALEENLKRRDITPIEVARAVDKYLESFADTTEQDLAEQLTMTQGNISNMRRVLRLPEQVLEKIDQGRINFTMGRELLVFQGIVAGKNQQWSHKEERYIDVPKDEKFLMLEAIRGIKTETQRWGESCTVEGIQRCIHSVATSHLQPLEKEYGYSSREPLFDTRAVGCLKCEHVIRTHPTKSKTAHWCTNQKCWDWNQAEHKDRVAAAARAKMTVDVLSKVAAAEEKRQAEDISQEISPELREKTDAVDQELEERADQMERALDQAAESAEAAMAPEEIEFARARMEQLKNEPPDFPCKGCLNIGRCDGTSVYAIDGDGFKCDQRLTKGTAAELQEKAALEIPPELQSLVLEKAGTRAQVLDLNELWLGSWRQELKQGYALLSGDLERVDDPEECLERCTQGFHYGYDSRYAEGRVLYVCTNPKCLSKKKAAFTRAKNAAGQAKKKAEAAAIKRAIDETASLDKERMKLIVLSQLEGRHVSYAWGGTNIRRWWLEKLKLEAKPNYSPEIAPIFRALDAMGDEQIARLIVEFMLTTLTYEGDLQTYRIQTTQPLNWMGIGLNVEDKQ